MVFYFAQKKHNFKSHYRNLFNRSHGGAAVIVVAAVVHRIDCFY